MKIILILLLSIIQFCHQRISRNDFNLLSYYRTENRISDKIKVPFIILLANSYLKQKKHLTGRKLQKITSLYQNHHNYKIENQQQFLKSKTFQIIKKSLNKSDQKQFLNFSNNCLDRKLEKKIDYLFKANKVKQNLSKITLKDTQKLIDISLYGFLHVNPKYFKNLNKKKNQKYIRNFLINYFNDQIILNFISYLVKITLNFLSRKKGHSILNHFCIIRIF